MQENIWGLTDKQLEVLSYMSQGYSHTGICKLLKIKKSTIMTHTARIYQKLGLYPADEDINQYTTAAIMYLKKENKK